MTGATHPCLGEQRPMRGLSVSVLMPRAHDLICEASAPAQVRCACARVCVRDSKLGHATVLNLPHETRGSSRSLCTLTEPAFRCRLPSFSHNQMMRQDIVRTVTIVQVVKQMLTSVSVCVRTCVYRQGCLGGGGGPEQARDDNLSKLGQAGICVRLCE